MDTFHANFTAKVGTTNGAQNADDEFDYKRENQRHILVTASLLGHLNRDSVDESQTEMNIRVFPALLQDRREVRTATSTTGNPNGV